MTQHDASHVYEADSGSFEQRVLERSRELPVLVDFWAGWCAPCQMLAPVLEDLAAEFDGKFELVKIDTDRNQDLAARFGVRGLPTVHLFRNGEVVDGFVGVQPESAIRPLIERHLVTDADRLVQEALQPGRGEHALELLRRAHELEPTKPSVIVALAGAEANAGNAAAARQLLAALPANAQVEPAARRVAAQLTFAEALEGAPAEGALAGRLQRDAQDHEARFLLAMHHAAGARYDDALEELGRIVGADRSWQDGRAHEAMLAVLEQLDRDDPLATQWRRRLAAMIY